MGAAKTQIVLIIGGVLALVFGLFLADVVIDAVTVALTNASIGSFAGASSVGGLIPFIYFTMLVVVSVGMIGLGGRNLYSSSR